MLKSLLRTHKNDISEQRRLFVVAEQSISRLSGESEAPDFQKAMANPDISANDKFYLLHQAYLQLGKAQKLDSPLLKQWLFRIDSRKLSRPEMRQFHDVAQVVNSLSMISALKKDIDWDDPQNKNNLRSLLQIGDLYLKGLKDPNEAGAASVDYLRMFALVALGYMWGLMVKAAQEKLAADDGRKEFYESKIHTARFFFERMLPDTDARFKMITAGGKSLMTLDAANF